MKNPRILLSEMSVSPALNILDAANLEFCYDHVDEDNTTREDLVKILQQNLQDLFIANDEEELLS
jgi:hypothetical protein